jgi:hypothetical protein
MSLSIETRVDIIGVLSDLPTESIDMEQTAVVGFRVSGKHFGN